jgi:hypothetical protein
MHSRLFFRWTFIVVTSLSISLFLAGLPSPARVHAASGKPGLVTQGSLIALDKSGQPTGLCPLKHTSVKAEISGFLSRVLVSQEFHNPFNDKIEAVYTFPLPQNAAIDDMTMQVGERVVKAKIMQREQAQAVYEAARNAGQVASLLDQERPNIFTQSVANIMPGERVTVTISYIETLKYEDGSYEFVFPMVVGPRYIPGTQATPGQQADSPVESAAVPDAARINPPAMMDGMRAGHDISIEIALDAGLPVNALNSASHEIEMERPTASRAVVRLKEQSSIPNKDFVLKYDVAGSKVEDAVLAHRSAKGGFFTLILQPPDRVTVEDVTPKELVFVLDTSGSMTGFPFEKARETAKLALDNLYPQDTFNLITFSGDEHVLFSEPVPATPENLRKAKEFLDGSRSGGGTEMMKAIRAALDPSDAQGHIRIACFMTDGQVGNDMEIISEVQKHANARVFAMGFGSGPNGFLLDKMAEYGRGEVEYVTERDADVQAVAKRFHERVRNPLLTDLSIEWADLPVTDIYPQRIPDLFSAKPVVLSGRYTVGGRAVVRLRGKMSGRDFVREIPVELPENNSAHGLLATLWARRRIDNLMGQDMSGLQGGKMRDDLREEITKLGIDYRLMTQFTSFVAVEETISTDGGEPRRVSVPIEVSTGTMGDFSNNYAIVNATLSSNMSLCAVEVRTATEYQTPANLPFLGRSFKSVLPLSPGVLPTGANQLGNPIQDQLSVNGQRPTSNSFFIDGVSAGIGIAPGQNPGASVAGAMLGLTASGGTNNLVSADGIKEIAINTSGFNAEYGRTTGGQFSVSTRSGTNRFHGTAFEYFANDALDANDWFANSRGLAKPPHRLNNFGGTLGGPIRRDKTFFFAAYEGQRLRQPLVGITDVPSMEARRVAPSGIQSFLNTFPAPNGFTRPDGFSEFSAAYANPARHDATSVRLDEILTDTLSLSGRYNYASSEAEERGAGIFSLNTLNNVRSTTQTLTASASYVISPTLVAELRGNYSRLSARSFYRLDEFGGAIVASDAVLFPSAFTSANGFYTFDLNGRNAALATGGDVENVQRQFNLVGMVNKIAANHTLKFGFDYRRLSPIIGFQPFEQSVLFNRLGGALTGTASRLNLFTRSGQQRPVFQNLSFYAQDEWSLSTRLRLTYGLRWEINPPPSGANGQEPLAVADAKDPARLSLAPRGTPLWKTTYGNFSPRLGVAYELSQASASRTVLRANFGLLYDPGNEEAGLAFGDSFPFLAGQTFYDVAFPAAQAGDAIPSSNPNSPLKLPFVAFDPHLTLPYALQWSFGIEQGLGSRHSLSASYVGTLGRRLLLAQTLLEPATDFSFVRLITNGAKSDYHSLQVQFNRRLSKGLQALVSYTWANSIDNASQDSPARTLLRSPDARQERGPSDYDVRHLFNAVLTYDVPTLEFNRVSSAFIRNWKIDAFVGARSARPINVVYGVPSPYGFAYLRPDLLEGVPLYLEDAAAGGGRRLNPAAFSIPTVERQGTLGRNSLRGFPFYQLDVALRRQFNFTEDINLQFKIAAFNIFNHPNFADPLGTDASLGSRLSATESFVSNQSFGQSVSMSGRSLWGGPGRSFSSFYQAGGPRTLQFSLRLQF